MAALLLLLLVGGTAVCLPDDGEDACADSAAGRCTSCGTLCSCCAHVLPPSDRVSLSTGPLRAIVLAPAQPAVEPEPSEILHVPKIRIAQ